MPFAVAPTPGQAFVFGAPPPGPAYVTPLVRLLAPASSPRRLAAGRSAIERQLGPPPVYQTPLLRILAPLASPRILPPGLAWLSPPPRLPRPPLPVIVSPAWMPAGTAYYDGAAVFGDPSQLGAAVFAGSALAEDAFLGLAPGTTPYGPCQPPGGAIAITGVLTGPTAAAVAAAQSALQALATAGATGTGRLIVPTGFAGLPRRGWDAWDGCWWLPSDLVFDPGGIVPANPAWPSAGYRVPYRMIVRRSGALVQAGSGQGTPIPARYTLPWSGPDPLTPYVP